MANISGMVLNKAVAAQTNDTELNAQPSGVALESSMAKANRLIREHRTRVAQKNSLTIPPVE
jgi:hypothetical protein